MSSGERRSRFGEEGEGRARGPGSTGVPGRRTLAEGTAVQRKATNEGAPAGSAAPPPSGAADPVPELGPAVPGGLGEAFGSLTLPSRLHTPPVALPHQGELEAQFGQPLGGIQAHVGEAPAVQALGGRAAAEGDVVAFADAAPDRGTVAHEVTHVLQARSGNAADHAGAEAEADHAKANVAAGRPVGPITQGAAGIHLDTGFHIGPNDLFARDFLRAMVSVDVVTLSTVRFSGAAARHPMSSYIQGDLFDAIFLHPSIREHVHPFEERIDGLIAPELVQPIVDRARTTLAEHGGGVGPDHHVYLDPVGTALGNAMARQLQLSMTRMVPRVVQASNPRIVAKDAKGEDWWVDDGRPAPGSLTVSHPMDRVVALGLCSPNIQLDTGKFAAAHPELVKQAAEQVRAPRSQPITLRFPWERGLWHWVEASVADATAEEVAKVLFGSEDQAHRLSPMAPLFGFRGSDVAHFVPEQRQELNDLAAAHHPHPQAANAREIAAATRSHTEAERVEQIRAASRRPGQIDLDEPLFGHEPSAIDPPAAPAPIPVYPVSADVDPAAELAGAQGGERLTKERAKAMAAPTGKKHDELSVYVRADECIKLIKIIRPALMALGTPTATVDKQLATFERTQRESIGTCFADPEGEYALVDEQGKLLTRISKNATDAAAHLVLYGGVSKTDDGAIAPQLAEVPDFARGPLQEAGRALDSAISALPFPELATPRVDHAEHLTKMLRISVLEQSLHETRPTLQDALDTPGDRHEDGADYDPMELRGRNDNLLGELARARIELEADPATAEKKFAATQERAGDYSFEIAVIGNLEALDSVWGAIEGTEGFWKSGLSTLVGDALQRENRKFYKRFNDEVRKVYREAVDEKDKDQKEAKKAAAKKCFKDLVESPDFKAHFETVQQHIIDDATQKKWTKIAVGIAIAVVAMGLGQAYFGAAIAAGGGVLGAAATAAVIETGASAVLNKLILDVDVTPGGLITGLIASGAMYAVLGKALTVGRAAGVGGEVGAAATKASMLEKAGQLAGDLTKEFLMVQAIGMVQGQIANLIDHGQMLSEAQLKEMFIHNIAGLVGMKIGQRLVDVTIDPMKPLRELGRPHGIDVDGLAAERAALIELSKRVENTADPAARQTLAESLVQREKAFLENVRETRDRLIELAEKNPGKIGAATLKDLKAMPEYGQDAEIMQASALMSVEEFGPNLYRADARAFDAILALHKKAGEALVGVHTDPVTGLRTLEFASAEGGVVKVTEKLGDVGERTAPAVPPAEAKRFEDWLDESWFHPDPAVAATHRQRLRDYYARDPKGAMHIAERHGFQPQTMPETAPLATKAGEGVPAHPTAEVKSAPDRAYDHYLHDALGDDGPKMSRIGDEPTMSRSDFEAMSKAGFEYDPVTRKWVLAAGRTAAGSVGHTPPQLVQEITTVIGPMHSEALGHQVVRMLVNGEAGALRLVGIEPPPGFDPQRTEWGLGWRESDRQLVLIRGGKGEINWSHIPGVHDVAHSHPLYDPITGKVRWLTGTDRSGVVDIKNLASFTESDLVFLMPSTGDLSFLALLKRLGHRLLTPYVSLGNGKIGNPIPGHNLDTVEFVIAKAEPYKLAAPGSSMVVWKAELQVWAGDHFLGRIELYQKYLDIGTFKADLPTLRPDASWAPIPADHWVWSAMPDSTPAGGVTAINKVSAESVGRLHGMGVNLEDAPLRAALDGLNQKRADDLAAMIDHQQRTGKITGGLEHMVERLKTEPHRVAEDMTLIKAEIDADPTTQVQFGADGKPSFSNGSGRENMPGDVVARARASAGSVTPKLDQFEYRSAADRDRIRETALSGIRDKVEDTYRDAIAAGDTHEAALKKATDAGTKEAKAQGKAPLEYAADLARTAIAEGHAFATIDAATQAQIAAYNAPAAAVGARGRVLIETLPRSEQAFLAFMASEVAARRAWTTSANVQAPTKGMPPGTPNKQLMVRWEYADGTLVRYKPRGDTDRPNVPSFSIEIKKDVLKEDRFTPDNVAFKLDGEGRAAPRKYNTELQNPFTNKDQLEAFNDAAMREVHHELTRP